MERGDKPKPLGGLIDAIVKALRSKRGDPEAAREGAEEINKVLPAGLSGREAVLRKRKQYEDIDKMLEEANR